MEDERYDSLMKTKYGIVLRIDKDFLRTFSTDEYRKKVDGLKRLKREVLNSNIEKNKKLLARLRRLEIVFKQDIDLLPNEYPGGSGSTREACWKE